jgi:hypothetical protein
MSNGSTIVPKTERSPVTATGMSDSDTSDNEFALIILKKSSLKRETVLQRVSRHEHFGETDCSAIWRCTNNYNEVL